LIEVKSWAELPGWFSRSTRAITGCHDGVALVRRWTAMQSSSAIG